MALQLGHWQTALDQANRWQGEEPFASRPAMLGTFISVTALENFDQAELMARRGLQSNTGDAILYNNLAFALAQTGRVDEAQTALSEGWSIASNQRQNVCLTATKGLIAFRSGEFDRGRAFYTTAIATAGDHKDLACVATIYYAVEEIRLRSPFAASAETQALEAIESLTAPFQSVFRDKLRRARETPERVFHAPRAIK